MQTADFFAFARERHAIHLRRAAGLPEPWTDDPILGTYRFTNVFRELDRTTVWFRENVRNRLAEMTPCQQVLGTILFRTLNRITSGVEIFQQNRLFDGEPVGWFYLREDSRHAGCPAASIQDVEDQLRTAIPRGPWVTGAYIVKTPDGMDKLRGALWIVEEARKRLWATLAEWDALDPSQQTLEAFWRMLLRYPYLGGGGFMAYEIVTDLRHLPILRDAPDVDTWANAGPGAKRGINRLLGWDKDHRLPSLVLQDRMRELLRLSQSPEFWPQVIHDEGVICPNAPGWEHSHKWGHVELGGPWPRWEMREVEHTLCEFDKYERVRLGEGRPRGRFR